MTKMISDNNFFFATKLNLYRPTLGFEDPPNLKCLAVQRNLNTALRMDNEQIERIHCQFYTVSIK